jgi:hypothetical protein
MGKRGIREDSDYAYAREKLRALTAPNSPAITDGNAQLMQYAQAVSQLQRGNPDATLQTLGTQSRQACACPIQGISANRHKLILVLAITVFRYVRAVFIGASLSKKSIWHWIIFADRLNY